MFFARNFVLQTTNVQRAEDEATVKCFTPAASHPKVVVISSFLHADLTPRSAARNTAREADKNTAREVAMNTARDAARNTGGR